MLARSLFICSINKKSKSLTKKCTLSTKKYNLAEKKQVIDKKMLVFDQKKTNYCSRIANHRPRKKTVTIKRESSRPVVDKNSNCHEKKKNARYRPKKYNLSKKKEKKKTSSTKNASYRSKQRQIINQELQTIDHKKVCDHKMRVFYDSCRIKCKSSRKKNALRTFCPIFVKQFC